MTFRVEMAAAAAAQAEADEAAASGPFEAATVEAAKVRTQLDAFRAEREAIRLRRKAGGPRGNDGERLAVLDVDMESLAEILPGAEAQVAATKRSHQAAMARLEGARAELAASVASSEVTALQEHAAELIRLLGHTLDRHRAAAGALHHRGDLEEARAGAIAVADAVDPVLLSLVMDIGQLGDRFGDHRAAWWPSDRLAGEIRKAQLAHDRTRGRW